jgi:hypothetical protein
MGLYNIVFGRNPETEIILKFLRLKVMDFHRFRDVNVESDDDGHTYIVVLVKIDDNHDFSSLPYFTIQVADSYDSSYNFISFDVTDHPQIHSIKEYLNNDDTIKNRMSPERWDHAADDIAVRIKAGENHPIKKILERIAEVNE